MSDKPTSPQNRRRCRRLPPQGGTRAACFKGTLGLGLNLALSILDISEEGVRLLIKQQLEVGQEIEINLENLNQRRPLKVLATVAWVVPTADGSWCVGVRFQRTLRYADVVQFVRV